MATWHALEAPGQPAAGDYVRHARADRVTKHTGIMLRDDIRDQRLDSYDCIAKIVPLTHVQEPT